MSDIALEAPRRAELGGVPGLSINGFVNAPNAGIAFVVLKPSEERHEPELSAGAIVGALNQQFFRQIQEAIVAIFPPPPVQGSGTVGGFKLYVEDRAGTGFEELYGQLQDEHGEGADGAVAGRTVLELPGQRAADRRRRRSRAREELRRAAHRRVRDAAGLSRLALRQRLQPLRPHLPGQRAGGVGLPPAAGADPPARDAQRARRDGAARLAGDRVSAATGPIR